MLIYENGFLDQFFCDLGQEFIGEEMCLFVCNNWLMSMNQQVITMIQVEDDEEVAEYTNVDYYTSIMS